MLRRRSNLSRNEWLERHLSQNWKISTDTRVPYINTDGYNVCCKDNGGESWSYRLKRRNTSIGEGEEWSHNRFGSKLAAQRAALERLADLLGMV